MSRRQISTPDFYIAVGNCLRCWENVETNPPGAPDGWLELAVMSGVMALAASLTPMQRPLPFTGDSGDQQIPERVPTDTESALMRTMIQNMAHDASIPRHLAGALFVRLFVDVLVTPAFHRAFEALPTRVQQQWASAWAAWSVAAWSTGWFPDLKGPIWAAGYLSAGWHVLFNAAAVEFDNFTMGHDVSTGEAEMKSADSRVVMAPPVGANRLPSRRNNASDLSSQRRISDLAIYLYHLKEVHDRTALSVSAKATIQEFAARVAHLDLTVGRAPVAAWIRVENAAGPVVNILGAEVAFATSDGDTAVMPLAFASSPLTMPVDEIRESAPAADFCGVADWGALAKISTIAPNDVAVAGRADQSAVPLMSAAGSPDDMAGMAPDSGLTDRLPGPDDQGDTSIGAGHIVPESSDGEEITPPEIAHPSVAQQSARGTRTRRGSRRPILGAEMH